MNEHDNNMIFDKASFISNYEAFDYLFEITDPREFESMKLNLKGEAKSLGVPASTFNSLLKVYQRSKNLPKPQTVAVTKLSDFNFNMGAWSFGKNYSVIKTNGEGVTTACAHPIWIKRKMVNCISGERKVELVFSRDIKNWKTIIVNKSVISTATSITGLNELGISVTSDNAKTLVTFLQNFEDLNYEKIPEVKSINRFGWIRGNRFSPYCEEYTFDSSQSFNEIKNAIKPSGDFSKWLDMAKDIRRNGDISARIILAASFSSVLIEPLGGLPFFVHLWGGTENGKTVALMLAASVWADPTIGRYAKSFNSTAVAQETIAGLLYSMPLVLDELQSVSSRKSFDKMIYELTEGTGRARGNISGGLRETLTWKNCILSSGEQPITKTLSGGGAKNRIIEIECDAKLFNDPIGMCEILQNNYGQAGKLLIEKLTGEVIEQARLIKQEIYKDLIEDGFTEKQTMAASLIMTADIIVGHLLFDDLGSLKKEDISAYMLRADEVSKEVKSYEWLRGWLAQNGNKFKENEWTECYGKEVTGGIAIISTVLREACENEDIALEVLTSYLKKMGKLKVSSNGKKSRAIRIDGRSTKCYVILDEFEDD